MRIDSKNAVQQARSYFQDLFPTAQDVRLEEIELSADGQFWLVTYSFAKPEIMLFGAPVTNPQREYKVVKLDAHTGEPQGIKIRTLAGSGLTLH